MAYPGNYGGYPPIAGNPMVSYTPAQFPPSPYAAQQVYAIQTPFVPQQAYATQPQYAYPPATTWGAPSVQYAYAAPVAYAPAPTVTYAAPVAYTQYPTQIPPQMPMAPLNFVFQFQGMHLDRKDLFSKSDPFLAIFASRHPGGYRGGYILAKREDYSTRHIKRFGGLSGKWAMIHRTETLHNNQNPTWNPFVVDLYALCGGNYDNVFKIEVWDYDHHTNHDFIGGAVTSLRQLMASQEVRLINRRRIGFVNTSGRLQVLRCSPA